MPRCRRAGGAFSPSARNWAVPGRCGTISRGRNSGSRRVPSMAPPPMTPSGTRHAPARCGASCTTRPPQGRMSMASRGWTPGATRQANPAAGSYGGRWSRGRWVFRGSIPPLGRGRRIWPTRHAYRRIRPSTAKTDRASHATATPCGTAWSAAAAAGGACAAATPDRRASLPSPAVASMPRRMAARPARRGGPGGVDAAGERLVLEALAPERIPLALDALEPWDLEREALARQWQLRLARARYDALRAQRQYDAVEPDNRLVARALEQPWEDTLRAVEPTARAYAAWPRDHQTTLTLQDRHAMGAMGAA